MQHNNAVLNATHFRAVIRVALCAHGLAVSRERVDRAVAERSEIGQWLRDEALPARLPGFAVPADYAAVARADPYLWERLPHMLGFGHQQATVFRAFAAPTAGLDSDAAVLAAVFSAGIALTDYLTDEVDERAGVRAVLHPRAVCDLLDPAADADATFAASYERLADPRLRLLCTLVAMCGAGFRNLLVRGGNQEAWAGLVDAVKSLYEAELVVSTAKPTSRGALRRLLPAIEAKSALPFVATCRIMRLGGPRGQEPARAELAAAALGRIVSLTDDLADFPVDFHRGAPNAVVLRLADVLAERRVAWPSDADVYDVVDAVAEDIVRMLQPGAFGSEDGGGAVAAGPAAAALEFARLVVAYWTGWQEDDAAVLVQPDSRREVPSSPIGAATQMLLAQQRDGYREAIHDLRLPRLRPEGPSFEPHRAVLFQRAVVLDGLLDALAAGGHVPAEVLAAEAIWILRAKHRHSPGGWNYVPEVPELPPDADDLGMVVQGLCRVGGPALAATCDEGIWFALAAGTPDGGIPTWILVRNDQPQADGTTDVYLELAGGQGVHPDVVANLVAGLLRYDPERYREEVVRAAGYLASVQDERGAWPSRWYAGAYYGTFRAVSALGVLAPGSAALDRASGFLRQHQRTDGSWGDGWSDPLATAFALLSLMVLMVMRTGVDDPAVQRGLAYLVDTQEADGGWPASPFISFLSADGARTRTYASRTITTAFCLKALAAAARSAAAGTGGTGVLARAGRPTRAVSTVTATDWG